VDPNAIIDEYVDVAQTTREAQREVAKNMGGDPVDGADPA
jgi:hypothetical protein